MRDGIKGGFSQVTQGGSKIPLISSNLLGGGTETLPLWKEGIRCTNTKSQCPTTLQGENRVCWFVSPVVFPQIMDALSSWWHHEWQLLLPWSIWHLDQWVIMVPNDPFYVSERLPSLISHSQEMAQEGSQGRKRKRSAPGTSSCLWPDGPAWCPRPVPVPILVLSACPKHQNHLQSLALGDFLEKP